MKWIKQDYKGDEQVWYSGDVVQKIKQTCYNFGLIHHKDAFGNIIATEGNPLAAKILRIIDEED